MEEMENENKMLRDQMKEHQERVDKIPSAPKLLPKRDVGRFVEQPHSNDLSKEQVPSVLLKKFCETLTGGALTWYSQLPARLISTFEEMADKFATAHTGAKKAEARVNDIFAIRQTAGEGLRDFLARFNRVRMGLPNMSEGMAVAAFQNGLSRSGSKATKKLLNRLMKYTPTTWEEIHNAYCTEVRADEDDLNGPTQRLASVQSEVRRDQRSDGQRDQLPRFNRERHQPYVRNPNPPPPRNSVRTRETGHEGAVATKDEIGPKRKKGYLKELLSDKGKANFARGQDPSQGPPRPPSPARTIQMIIGGGDDSVINHVKFATMHKLKRTITHERYDGFEDSIIIEKSNTDGLSFPHYDALVITLRIADTDVKRIMVDDGSSACIIHPRVLMRMKLEDKIIPRCITLTGFNNAVERTSGEIALPVLAGGVTLETTFHVMDQETAYNAIIGRPWIHAMRAVPSSFYQVIKFPTPWGIFSIRGELRTAQECYQIAQDCTHTK
ncbi:PREDICTED: uncharacterized protein LOC109218466 [Nicotiana attenuata]|uniref:uncharacterized protein LOC109218466 n=1 Tax=Nicotiana attenuata TaxID=49451 RepID=UPI00090474F6|nr:PREDICTED: uncharacterized protein LOC109218466 [Nicotiana attenuata]